MRAARTVVLFMAASLALYPRALDPSLLFKLLDKGSNLSAAEAAKLEDVLKNKPRDQEARVQLLSYYANPPVGADLTVVKAARARHILWLIANDPKDGLGLFQVSTGVYRLHCQGDELADPNAYAQASETWLDQARKNPSDARVRTGAVRAIEYCTPEQAEPILMQDHNKDGLGALYASAVLGITGESYRNSDPAGSDAALRSRPFAEKARRTLEAATDKEILVGAARTLLREGAILWADGKLDWDYTPLGNDLLARAKRLAPDEITLVTLPTKLPARGERPPVTIRVGGNVQQKMALKKVPPFYPMAARDHGITGTVELSVIVGLDGKILYLKPVSGPRELIPPSIEAVQQWEYRPTMLNGRPCYVETRIDVNYTLGRS